MAFFILQTRHSLVSPVQSKQVEHCIMTMACLDKVKSAANHAQKFIQAIGAAV